jgi:hypothetical protein
MRGSITLRVEGMPKVIARMKAIQKNIKGITPLAFAKEVAKEANRFQQMTKQGYPQQSHKHLLVSARLETKGKRGSKAIIFASGISKAGFNYAQTQDSGSTERKAKGKGYMVFPVTGGRWVKVKTAAPITGKGYIEFGREYAMKNFRQAMEIEVRRILVSKGKTSFPFKMSQ